MMCLNQNFARAIHFSALDHELYIAICYNYMIHGVANDIDKYYYLYFDTINFERSSRLSGKS